MTALVVVATLLLAVAGGWPAVSAVLHVAARSADSGGPDTSGEVRGGADGTAAERPGAPTGADPATAPVPTAAAGTPSAGAGTATGVPSDTLLRGGTWIGLLERLAVTGTILLGHPEGVAVVVAVKGLGRYPELARNPDVSERFVIGSLASLVWAVGLGALGRALL
jgi:hypothetical protein